MRLLLKDIRRSRHKISFEMLPTPEMIASRVKEVIVFVKVILFSALFIVGKTVKQNGA